MNRIFIIISAFAAITLSVLLSGCNNGKVEVLAEHPTRSEISINNNYVEMGMYSGGTLLCDNEQAYQYLLSTSPRKAAESEDGRLYMFVVLYPINIDYDNPDMSTYSMGLGSKIPFGEIEEGTVIEVLMVPSEDGHKNGFNGKQYKGQVEVAKKSNDKLTIRFNKAKFKQVDNQDNVWTIDGLVCYQQK